MSDLNPSQPVPAAVFLSGAGTNAEALLRSITGNTQAPWRPCVLVTDRPETSRAREIAARFHLPLVEHDIERFYRTEGMAKVTIRTEEGMRIREKWTHILREFLKPFPIRFGILAGFVPLCNITQDFPCLNVHPGNLTVTENGNRIFAGLHLLPIETAILHGDRTVRSSVIVAQSVSTGAEEMDAGPVLGVSGAMNLDLQGHTIAEFQEAKLARTGKKTAEYRSDILRSAALFNVERLKKEGDWKLFPRVVCDFARGYFTFEPLRYRGEAVTTVVYEDGRVPFPSRNAVL